MKWLKEIIVDIIVTAAIVAAVLLKLNWLVAVVVGYTGLILIFRVILFFNKSLNLQRKLFSSVPDWFFHAVYKYNFGQRGIATLTFRFMRFST